MTNTDINITLIDNESKRKNFTLTTGKNGFYSKPGFTDRNFGYTYTQLAEINNIRISGDLWRFIEGTLGLETLYDDLNQEFIDKPKFINDFIDEFNGTPDDDEALTIWNDQLKYEKNKNLINLPPRCQGHS